MDTPYVVLGLVSLGSRCHSTSSIQATTGCRRSSSGTERGCPTLSGVRGTTRGSSRCEAIFKVENGSLLSEAATLEELEWVIDRQMLYYNQERRHSGLDYRAPMAYLEDQGIHPKVLVEIGPRSGSVSGAQVRLPTPS